MVCERCPVAWSVVVAWIVAVNGCGAAAPADFLKVAGVIHVDDRPVSGVSVFLHPESGGGMVSTGLSDDVGRFEISTHRLGDGAPLGKYTGTFQWGDYDVLSRSRVGDRLQGRYSQPKNSKFHWELSGVEPLDLGVISLTTVGP